jgi:pyridoxamine 5'-phosphate oxidase family protein
MMALVEALIVIGVVTIIVSLLASAIIRHTAQPQTTSIDASSGWVATHYTLKDVTRVVVRKIGRDTGEVLDEHVLEEIANADPDFDARFLHAMEQARYRAALFESESD